MKKIFAVMAILAAVAFTASAQTGFSVGARAGAGFGFNSTEGMLDTLISYANSFGYSIDESSNITFAAALYGGYTIFEGFSVQLELDLMINNGMELSGGGVTMAGSYTSLDIPLLARYDFLESPLTVGVLAGPYLSLGIGKFKGESEDPGGLIMGTGSEETDIDGVRFGITAGLVAGYPVGPGLIIADLRFLTDLTPLKVKESGVSTKVFTRRGLNVTLGYELKL
jgi:hypothetical protein